MKLVAEDKELGRVLAPGLAHWTSLGDVSLPPTVVATGAGAVSSHVSLPATREALRCALPGTAPRRLFSHGCLGT